MPRSAPALSSFNAGEWAPAIAGRVDLERYPSSLRTLENFIPQIQGAAFKRSGTRFVHQTCDNGRSRLIPFQFNREQSYVVELCNLKLRIYRNENILVEDPLTITGATAANPVVVSVAAHGYISGQEIFVTGILGMTELNDRFFQVGATTAGTFELAGIDGTAFTAYVSGGTSQRVQEIVTPYLESELQAIQFTQSADVMYLVHTNHEMQKLTRDGNELFSLVESEFDWVAFEADNIEDDDFIVASSATGTGIVLTSSTGRFVPSDVGAYVSLAERFQSNHWQWLADSDPARLGFSTGDFAYFEDNIYRLVDKNAAARTGTSAPVHEMGNKNDGKWMWEFVHTGRGYAKITAFTTAFRVTADVIKTYPDATVDADVALQSIDNTTPITVNATGHPYETGDTVYILGFTGAGAALDNQNFVITDTGANSFELDGTTAIGADATTAIGVRIDTGDSLAHFTGSNNTMQDHDLFGFSAFSETKGFARVVAFFEARLYIGGGDGSPDTLYGSKVDEFEDHQRNASLVDFALFFTLGARQVNAIEWIVPQRSLLVGTQAGESQVDAAVNAEAVTSDNVRAKVSSAIGVRQDVRPLLVDELVIFAQRAGVQLIEYEFDDSTKGFAGTDLAVLTEHITRAQIKELSFARTPDRIIWVLLEDGTLASVTYQKPERVVAWAPQVLGGTDAKVLSIATIPQPNDGAGDQAWAVVERTIDSTTQRYVEFVEQNFTDQDVIADAFFVDSGLTYTGPPLFNITGLDHLEGEPVAVLADGLEVTGRTVVSGTLSPPLTTAASTIHVGLSYAADLETQILESGAATGTAQGKIQRITQAVVRLDQTGSGLQYGPDLSRLRHTFPIRVGTLLTDDTDVLAWPAGHERGSRLALRHSTPLPCSVLAIFPKLNTVD